ncbi:hypothetical protein RF11_08472 [Thelohanellus kitauei]|uniref:Uncharacterized protein n=1 Tax=Thelohanellus kitauei TaxID=669202 RepID=A0A0C2MAE7_THEKT|nr:hypothetical protein RF11_08472 [Thelohanellus kitauei]
MSDNHVEMMLETYIIPRDSKKQEPFSNFDQSNTNLDEVIENNFRKYCLFMLVDSRHYYDNFTEYLKTTLHMFNDDSILVWPTINKYGYGCVRYLFDIDESEKAKDIIHNTHINLHDNRVNI